MSDHNLHIVVVACLVAVAVLVIFSFTRDKP